MTQHLVITAVGTDRPGICNQVVQLVTQSGCNIIDSRIAMFGEEFTLIMLLSGKANNITRVETTLPLLGQEHDLITIMKRTSPHDHIENSYTLEVFIESDDRLGLTENSLSSSPIERLVWTRSAPRPSTSRKYNSIMINSIFQLLLLFNQNVT